MPGVKDHTCKYFNMQVDEVVRLLDILNLRKSVVDMPWRAFLTKEMSEFLGVLAHAHRVRIVQELRNGEMDVNGLQEILEITHSRVSQHLSVLRAHRIVVERREGRHVFYRLVNIKLAQWLADGLEFLQTESTHQSEVKEALRKSRSLWSEPVHAQESTEKDPVKLNGSDAPH
jgi:DNA-binding transcriptional ArsR family regulator